MKKKEYTVPEMETLEFISQNSIAATTSDPELPDDMWE